MTLLGNITQLQIKAIKSNHINTHYINTKVLSETKSSEHEVNVLAPVLYAKLYIKQKENLSLCMSASHSGGTVICNSNL